MRRKPLVCAAKSGVIIGAQPGESELRRAMKNLILSLLMLASLGASAQDLPPEGAVWQYSITPNGIAESAYGCVIGRLPANPATNQGGFAANEGAFFTETEPGLPHAPPSGLARIILDCVVTGWDSPGARFCFVPPTPWYTGFYPFQRIAQVNIFFCAHPTPVIYDYYVTMRREAYFPPPVMASGFE